MVLRTLLLAAIFALATVAVGWWGVPVAAAAWGAFARARPVGRRDAGATALVAGVVAWGALLLWASVRGSVAGFAARLGAAVGAPGALVIAATLLFAATLAWSAASVAQAAAGAIARGTRR